MNYKLQSLFLVLLLITFSAATAQQNKPDYLPGVLMIKFKDASTSTGSSLLQKDNPRQKVEQLLGKFGMTGSRPLWNKTFNNQLQKYKTLNSRLPADPAAPVRNIYQYEFSSDISPQYLAAKISRLPGVVYAEPKYIAHTEESTVQNLTPNDPILADYLAYHRFYQAWDINPGSKDIVIGIVDSGVDYTNEDLRNKLWVNQGELDSQWKANLDANSDNEVTSSEILTYLQNNNGDYDDDGTIDLQDALNSNAPWIDGTDNDGNNFVDDLFGWDFWQSGYTSGNIVQDNNPVGEYSDHGTHVAGIAAAEPNNNFGLAGTGYNTRYMAIKTGGVKDDPSTPNTNESDQIWFGYDGMLYAAMNGADVINASWGGSGYSQVAQDVITAVNNLGTAVIAAAGNENSEGANYPSAYNGVLSIGALQDTSGTRASYSNYGYSVDVFAVGTFIKSTTFDDTLATKSGTSMATPVVAGLAALVKAQHPDWSPHRIIHQIRSTASSIDDKNGAEYAYKLGTGAVKADAALQTDMPGVEILSASFKDTQGGKLMLGEDGTITVSLANYGKTTQNLTLNLATDQNVTIQNGSSTIGALATDDTAEATFDIHMDENFDLSQVPLFRIDITDPGTPYSDFGHIAYPEIYYDVLAANNIKTSFGADGTIGFLDPLSGIGGVGFIPRQKNSDGTYTESSNILFEGGLMILANGYIANAVRSINDNLDRDFVPLNGFNVTSPGTISDADGETQFTTGNQDNITPPAKLKMSTYAFTDTLQNVVFTRYDLSYNNLSGATLDSIYIGLFNDWDLGNSGNNGIRYSKSDSILYVFDEDNRFSGPYVAVANMGVNAGVLAIDNAYSGSSTSPYVFGIYDGFTDDEKIAALKSDTMHTSVSNTDVSAVVSTGPFTIKPGNDITAGFIYAFGDNILQLKSQIHNARAYHLFDVTMPGTYLPVEKPVESIPRKTRLYANYPNPFNPTTQIKFDLAQNSNVKLRIFNILGQRVATLASKKMTAGTHVYQFDASQLSSGIYLAVLETDGGVQTIKMNLIK